jgi:hypothetical protein
MSFYKYDKKRFLKDIEEGCEFDFKSSSWVIILSVISFLIFVPIGILLFTFSLPFGITLGTIFIIIAIIGLCGGIQLNSRKIKINPKTIKWSGGFSSRNVDFADIEDISFFPSAFFNLNTAKLFLYKGVKYKVRTSLMKTPKKWYSEDMIRTIIDYYWHAANPEAKHSKKSVSSVPSEGKGTISLIKPKKEHIGSLEGIKCQNCLFIAEKKVKFCPKCGFALKND